MKIDDTNLEIIRHLQEGRKSFKLIAEELNITENTVRSRVNRLQDEGVLDFTGTIDPEGLPGHKVLMIGVKLKTVDLLTKGREFSALRGVLSVGVVTGRYDLFLQVLINDDLTLLEFLTVELAKVDDIQEVETFVVYKGYNLKVPYIL